MSTAPTRYWVTFQGVAPTGLRRIRKAITKANAADLGGWSIQTPPTELVKVRTLGNPLSHDTRMTLTLAPSMEGVTIDSQEAIKRVVASFEQSLDVTLWRGPVLIKD